jgi:hypothetical protein
MKLIQRPANEDMISGYLDGRDIDNPEPSSNRSHSYRHGFAVGRNERINKHPIACFDEMMRRADAAMDADDAIDGICRHNGQR